MYPHNYFSHDKYIIFPNLGQIINNLFKFKKNSVKTRLM